MIQNRELKKEYLRYYQRLGIPRQLDIGLIMGLCKYRIEDLNKASIGWKEMKDMIGKSNPFWTSPKENFTKYIRVLETNGVVESDILTKSYKYGPDRRAKIWRLKPTVANLDRIYQWCSIWDGISYVKTGKVAGYENFFIKSEFYKQMYHSQRININRRHMKMMKNLIESERENWEFEYTKRARSLILWEQLGQSTKFFNPDFKEKTINNIKEELGIVEHTKNTTRQNRVSMFYYPDLIQPRFNCIKGFIKLLLLGGTKWHQNN